MWHVLNSAGIERFPQYQFDMVRLGIGIYGISALPGVRLDPVASLKVKVLQVKKLRPGAHLPGDGDAAVGRHDLDRHTGLWVAHHVGVQNAVPWAMPTESTGIWAAGPQASV